MPPTCPQLAPLGLEAARRYAKVAPSSPHALHMPSHIFTRLGLWQDSIASNIASAAAAQTSMAIHMGGTSHAAHAMDFLNYAYLQIGRDADAQHMVDEVKAISGIKPESLAFSVTKFEVRYAIETHDWRRAAAVTAPAGANLGVQAMALWAAAMGDARSGDAAAARQALDQFGAVRTKMLADHHEYGSHPYATEYDEASAWVSLAEGKKDDALKTLRAAADREDADGVDDLMMPAREMLGDIQLALGQPVDALIAYETACTARPKPHSLPAIRKQPRTTTPGSPRAATTRAASERSFRKPGLFWRPREVNENRTGSSRVVLKRRSVSAGARSPVT